MGGGDGNARVEMEGRETNRPTGRGVEGAEGRKEGEMNGRT